MWCSPISSSPRASPLTCIFRGWTRFSSAAPRSWAPSGWPSSTTSSRSASSRSTTSARRTPWSRSAITPKGASATSSRLACAPRTRRFSSARASWPGSAPRSGGIERARRCDRSSRSWKTLQISLDNGGQPQPFLSRSRVTPNRGVIPLVASRDVRWCFAETGLLGGRRRPRRSPCSFRRPCTRSSRPPGTRNPRRERPEAALLVGPGGSDDGCCCDRRHLRQPRRRLRQGEPRGRDRARAPATTRRSTYRSAGSAGSPVVVRAASRAPSAWPGWTSTPGRSRRGGAAHRRARRGTGPLGQAPSSIAGITIRDVRMPWAFDLRRRASPRRRLGRRFQRLRPRNLEDGIEIWERDGVPTNGVTISGVLIHDVDGGRDGTCSGTAVRAATSTASRFSAGRTLTMPTRSSPGARRAA